MKGDGGCLTGDAMRQELKCRRNSSRPTASVAGTELGIAAGIGQALAEVASDSYFGVPKDLRRHSKSPCCN